MGDADRPLRILQVVGPSSGGMGRHVAELSRRLLDRGHDVRIMGPAGSVPEAVLDAGVRDRFEVADIARSRKVFGAARQVRLGAAGFDVVHAHGLTAGWISVLARPAGRVVATVHNLVLDEAEGAKAGGLRRLEAALPGRVARVIAISPEVARRFAGLPGSGRIDVVAPVGPRPRPSQPPEAVRAALGVPATEALVVLVGRLHPQKDVGTLLAATRRLVDAGRPLAVAVVGEGPSAAGLAAERDRLGLAAVVRFIGSRPHAANEMAAADLVVCSSRWESFGLVVAEALELGRPVVATAVGRIPEMVVDGETGRLVPSGDPTALADAMAEQLDDPTLAARRAQAGQARVRARFGPEVLVDGVIGSYRRAIA